MDVTTFEKSHAPCTMAERHSFSSCAPIFDTKKFHSLTMMDPEHTNISGMLFYLADQIVVDQHTNEDISIRMLALLAS